MAVDWRTLLGYIGAGIAGGGGIGSERAIAQFEAQRREKQQNLDLKNIIGDLTPQPPAVTPTTDFHTLNMVQQGAQRPTPTLADMLPAIFRFGAHGGDIGAVSNLVAAAQKPTAVKASPGDVFLDPSTLQPRYTVPLQPKIAFAPNGRAVNENDTSIIGQDFSKAPDRKVEFVNGQAVDPYNIKPGTVIPKQQDFSPEALLVPGANGQMVPNMPLINARAQLAKATREAEQGASADKFDKPISIEADDGAGGRAQFLAQQDRNTGEWVTADKFRKPLENVQLPENVPGGARTAGQINRIINAAKDAVTGLQNISQLPSTATGSLFGANGQTTSLLDVGKRWLGNSITSQEVQDANVSFVGLGKALATLDSGGLQSSQALMTQMDKLQLMPGDTQYTKMRKLAEIRQLADNSLETTINGPLLSTTQKKYAQTLRDALAKAIPWTPNDVSKLQQSKSPTATLRDYAVGQGLGGGNGWTVQKVQ